MPVDLIFRPGDVVNTVRDVPTQSGDIREGTQFTIVACWLDARGERVTLGDITGRLVLCDTPADLVAGF